MKPRTTPQAHRPDKKRASEPLPPLHLSFLGYQEDGEWVALALEMDLRGYGSTLRAAFAELMDLVGMQLGFAQYKGQPDLVWRPAEPIYWQLFENARRDRIQGIGRPSSKQDYEVGSFPVPKAHVIQELAKFRPANG